MTQGWWRRTVRGGIERPNPFFPSPVLFPSPSYHSYTKTLFSTDLNLAILSDHPVVLVTTKQGGDKGLRLMIEDREESIALLADTSSLASYDTPNITGQQSATVSLLIAPPAGVTRLALAGVVITHGESKKNATPLIVRCRCPPPASVIRGLYQSPTYYYHHRSCLTEPTPSSW